MCGLCGFVVTAGNENNDRLNRMVSEIRHRGPDAAGTYAASGVGLGHVRLSIIDVCDRSNQPMLAPDAGVALAFNGEIYNYRELRTELLHQGAVFSTDSDTEVILQGYLLFGAAFVQRLSGMFAFVIHDRRLGRLVVARDRLGIKPLYFHRMTGGIAFASEAKALVASALPEPQVDEDALAAYLLFGNSFAGSTMLRGIEKFPPAHILSVNTTSGEETWSRYWVPTYGDTVDRSTTSIVDALRYELIAAVRRHMIADVEVGAFLSGGIDSSAVVAIMAREMTTAPRTYSVGFSDGTRASELPAARALSQLLKTNHTELIISSRDVADLLPALAYIYDEPFGDAANLPVYCLARAASRDLKVVLTGEGGDELFAGYRRYTSAAWSPSRKRVAAQAARALLPIISKAAPLSRVRRLAEIFSEQDGGRRAAKWISPVTGREGTVLRVLRPERLPAYQRGREHVLRWFSDQYATTSGNDPVNRMLQVDQRTQLVDTYLEKVDKATMAFGLEARVPLLDDALLDFAMRIPGTLKVRRGGKWILKRALQGILPETVLDRPKQGFGVPVSAWFRKDLREFSYDAFSSDMSAGDFIDPSRVRQLLDEHVRGDRDHGPFLWYLLMFEMWHRSYFRRVAANGGQQ